MPAENLGELRGLDRAVRLRGLVRDAHAVKGAKKRKAPLLIYYLECAVPVSDPFRLRMAKVEPADLVQKLALPSRSRERGGVACVHGVVLGAHGEERADVREHEDGKRDEHHHKVEGDLSAPRRHWTPPM